MTLRCAVAVAFLAGLAVMACELCAVRLLAPHFGDSAYVWTNVIGVILAALALGALLGGRAIDRGGSSRGLGIVLLAAALATALAPFLAPTLGDALVPQDLPLEAAMPALVRGSLAATVLLFGFPILLLGAVSPWLVCLAAKGGAPLGRAAGSISAAATLGSLLGTFVTTHWSVPHFGSSATLVASAVLLAVAGALCLRHPRKLALGTLALGAVSLLLLPLTGAARKARVAGEEVLEERESAYQFVQVVKTSDAGVGVVALKINEGLDSFHSLLRADGPLTAGAYYDYHAVAPLLAGAGRERAAPPRVLSLGSACGTFDRILAHVYPGCTVDEVEIDPAVLGLSDRHFGPKRARGARIGGLDARVLCNRTQGEYDAVLVDTYARQIYVPAHVTSREFFARAHALLREGGIVSVNLGGRSFGDRVIGAVAATMASVFGTAHAFRVPGSRNFMVLARRGAPLEHPPRHALEAARRLAGGALVPVVEAMQSPGAWREYGPDAGPVLRDAWPLLDALQDEALRERQVEGAVLALAGSSDPAAAAEAARTALMASDYEGALAALRTASRESAYLRFLAGDVRWYLHDSVGAELEYERAKSLDPKVVEPRVLADRQARVHELASKLVLADEVGRRNGWLAFAASAGLLVLAAAARRT